MADVRVGQGVLEPPEFPEYAWSNDGGNNDKLVKIVYLQKLTEFPAATTTTVYVQCISIAT